MDGVACANAKPSRRSRRRRRCVIEQVDVHCHCLPGIDDGPATTADAVELCRLLVSEGVTSVIATPHQLGRYDGRNEADDIRAAVAELKQVLKAERVPLRVLPGADVRLDERIEALLDEDKVLTLADGGRYILLELPHEVFIDPISLLRRLIGRGVVPIITHPERHRILITQPHSVQPWLEAGAVLQVTAASLLGSFGTGAEQAAWHWLGEGAVAVVASDAHDTSSRPPRLAEALDLLGRRLGVSEVWRLCFDNPQRILNGSDLDTPLWRKEER